MSKEQEKRDNENYAKNFTRVCNIVLESYKHLTHEEKFLYIKMRSVYWDAKPRFATLREISHLTDYTISALSRILPRLHKCGLVHAEIKQEFNPDGSKKGKPKYYITIPDIWELNRKYFECSPEERFDPSVVLLKNNNVPLKNNNVPLKNNNVPLKNNNVLQKNEDVLVENDVVPPEEHYSATRTPSQARSQAAKDSNKIFKDSKKEEAPDSLSHSSLQSSFAQEKYLSTPNVDKPVSDVEKSDLPIANPAIEKPTEKNAEPVTTGNASIERHTEKLDPLGIYSEEEKQQHQWWCQLGLAVKVNLTNKGHWATLSQYVQSFEDMQGLYDYTEQQIENDSSFQDKTVKPGNLANADNLNGWKKKKRRAEQPKDSSKSSSGSGMRNYTFDPEPQPTTQEPPSGELVAVPGFSLKAMREKLRKERANV